MMIDHALGLSATERRAVRRRAWWRWAVDRRTLACLAAAILAQVVVIPSVWRAITPTEATEAVPPQSAVLVVLLILGNAALLGFLVRRVYPAEVRRELRRRGHDICRRCGVSLEALTIHDTHCPSCGKRRRHQWTARRRPESVEDGPEAVRSVELGAVLAALSTPPDAVSESVSDHRPETGHVSGVPEGPARDAHVGPK